MYKIPAIVLATFRHCVRSRAVLLGIAAYAVAMALAFALTPAPVSLGGPGIQPTSDSRTFDAERALFAPAMDRIRSIQSTSVNVALFLGFAVAALVAATWLPAQIRGGELTCILSKPVWRATAVVGTFLGFLLVFAALFALYALLGIGTLRLAAATDADPAQASRQLETVRLETAADFGTAATKTENAPRFVVLSSAAEQAVWRFRGISFSRSALAGGAMTCRCVAEIARSDNPFVTHADLIARLLEPDGKMLEEVRIKNAQSGQTIEFTIPAEKISGGDFDIAISPAENGHKIACYPRGLVVLIGVSPFEWNYLKTFGLAFVGLTVFLSVAIAGSTFLSANVSIFFSTGVALAGGCIGFLREYMGALTTALQLSPAFTGVEGRHVYLTHLRGGWDAVGESVAAMFSQSMSHALDTITFGLVPDWGRFSGIDSLMQRMELTLSSEGNSLLYAAVYCVACLTAAAVIFGRRELK